MGKVFTGDMAQKYADVKDEAKWNVSEFHDKVVGVAFRKAEVAEVEDGDFLIIQPEIGNVYDEFACRVMHDKTGNQIGYVSRDYSEKVWKNIQERGDLYIGRATLTGGGDKERGINIAYKHFSLKNPG